MTVIIDYDTGNLCSLGNAVARHGSEYIVSSDHNIIKSADRVILPGVGEASTAMQKLKERGLDEILRELTCPVLGICIGMQLMCSYSEEGDTGCIGIFPNRVIKIRTSLKIPHMGWNTITNLKSPLFNEIQENSYQYFVHSFAPEIINGTDTIATTSYGMDFSAALNYKNFYGTQFHPEKSGEIGAAIIKNFLEL
jgi:glutamine amidotransferase